LPIGLLSVIQKQKMKHWGYVKRRIYTIYNVNGRTMHNIWIYICVTGHPVATIPVHQPLEEFVFVTLIIQQKETLFL
jgi:hypothetical protein